MTTIFTEDWLAKVKDLIARLEQVRL